MSTEHPITPPPELVRKWWDGTHGAYYEFEAVATQAARWGADQELEACCEWLTDWRCNDPSTTMLLRADRRPKPLSLKEQAMKALNYVREGAESVDDLDTIRRALEALSDD